MDYAFVSVLLFILWLAARKTRKLLKRLEPEEKLAQKTLIIIKADFDGKILTPAEPEAAVATETPAVAVEPEPAFEVEALEMEAEAPAVETEPEWKEFTWESAEEEAVSLR